LIDGGVGENSDADVMQMLAKAAVKASMVMPIMARRA
jgi:hypothetical protein